MKKHFLGVVVFFCQPHRLVIFTGGHSVAGENQLIRLGQEGKNNSVVAFDPANNKALNAGAQLGLLITAICV